MRRRRFRILAPLLLLAPLLFGSDHADPIDLFAREPEEGGITDLFVFPTTGGDEMVVILCVRRSLTEREPNLKRYTYTVNMDLTSTVLFPNPNLPDPMLEQYYARYGGAVQKPEGIHPTVEIAITFPGKVEEGQLDVKGGLKKDDIRLWTGVRDDPFIFPNFFHTNVVAMVMRIPFAAFPSGQQDYVVWATSKLGERQVDHVGRSLRTQNPRFDLLNPLKPSEHVDAIRKENERPSLMRDIFVRLGLSSTFGYREWDFVPDVMIYSRRFPVGYPNGRILTDDVAALLARYGDTLLYELSFARPKQWPRAMKNDKEFLDEPPYLAAPWDDPNPDPVPALKPATRYKLIAGAVVLLLVCCLLSWLKANWLEHRRRRRRYL